MRDALDNGEIYRIVVFVVIVGGLVLFAIFSGNKPADGLAGNTSALQVAFVPSMPQTIPPRNCLMYPYSPGCPRAGAVPQAGVVPGGAPLQTMPPRNCLMYPYAAGCPRRQELCQRLLCRCLLCRRRLGRRRMGRLSLWLLVQIH